MPSEVFSVKKEVKEEVTILAGKKKGLKLDVNGENITVPVDDAVFAHYQDQIYRRKPSTKQGMIFRTVRSLMRAAYLKGLEDGKNKK